MALWVAVALLSLACAQVTPPRTPTYVYVTVNLNSLDKIDGVEQAFNTDFWLSYYWYDPRVDLNITAFDDATMWDPALDFVNSRGAIDTFVAEKFEFANLDTPAKFISNAMPEDAATFNNSGWVQFNQRYVGSFSAALDLKQFPFDTQTAQIILESSIYSSDEVIFKTARPVDVFEKQLLPSSFVLTEWVLLDTTALISTTYYPTYDETYSSLHVEIQVERRPEYYLQKICAGCVLLVLMCITIFVLDVEEPDRMMGTLTVFLALISFVFVAAADLPKVAYLTRMDAFMMVSFLLVALMAFAHMALYALGINTKEDEEKEKKEKEKEREKGKDKSVKNLESSSTTVGGALWSSLSDGSSSASGAVRRKAELKTTEEEEETVTSATTDKKSAKTDSKGRKRVLSSCKARLGRFGRAVKGMGPVRKLDVFLMLVFLVVYIIAVAAILRKT